MRGRKPKPTYMRVLDGGAGHRPVNKDEPQPEGELADLAPPDHLSGAQKTIWRRAIANAPPGLLRKLDWEIFEQWVVHAERFKDAAKRVSESGSIVKSQNGTWYQNPFLSVMNKQSTLMMRAAAELGFTPSSRSRVKVDRKGAAKNNPFSDLKQFDGD